jgi:hypothetical protein
MNYALVLCGVSFCIYAYLLLSLPRRIKKSAAAAGSCVLKLKGINSKRWILIVILTAVLIALTALISLGLFVDCIICMCALLATELSVREAVSMNRAGIYEHMIISGSHAVPYDTVKILPTLAYEDDPDTTDVNKSTLKIITTDGASSVLIFSSEQERAAAVKTMLELVPRLAP